jgi:hypothetical protein
MSSAAPPPNLPLEAYKVASDHLRHEEAMFWTRNQVFLLLNSGLIAILVGILGLASRLPSSSQQQAIMQTTTQPPPALGSGATPQIGVQQIFFQQPAPQQGSLHIGAVLAPLVLLCFMGAFLSFVWWLIVERGRVIYDHFVEQLKYYEMNHLSGIEVFRIADEYLEEGQVTLGGKTHRLPRVARWVRIYKAWVYVAWVFFFVWLALAAWVVVVWVAGL